MLDSFTLRPRGGFQALKKGRRGDLLLFILTDYKKSLCIDRLFNFFDNKIKGIGKICLIRNFPATNAFPTDNHSVAIVFPQKRHSNISDFT